MNTTNRNAIFHLLNQAGRARGLDWESRVDFGALIPLMDRWYDDYKAFERDDTIARAYREQRLTVKGMDPVWQDSIAFKGADKQMHRFVDPRGKSYPLDKGMKGMRLRIDPRNFLPYEGGDSKKLELGLHDTSSGLMSGDRPISEQQYKKLEAGMDNVTKKLYVFMPLGYPEDQALFQMLNDLGKRVRLERPNFYSLVRFIRARMTRLKLAAEHDMSTNFSLATPVSYKINSAGETVPKFQFGLLAETGATVRDNEYLNDAGKEALKKKAKWGADGKIKTVPVTPELLSARRQAAINYQNLVLDQYSYGEVTVAYRKHEGGFPLFTMFSPDDKGFLVGTVDNDTWVAKNPKEIIPDRPV
jgi:hypothetical protein